MRARRLVITGGPAVGKAEVLGALREKRTAYLHETPHVISTAASKSALGDTSGARIAGSIHWQSFRPISRSTSHTRKGFIFTIAVYQMVSDGKEHSALSLSSAGVACRSRISLRQCFHS